MQGICIRRDDATGTQLRKISTEWLGTSFYLYQNFALILETYDRKHAVSAYKKLVAKGAQS